MHTKRTKLYTSGMTLVELMAVIAVISVLAGIMAYFVTGNKESKAQVSLANDISTLLQEQRTRAASMNVATYVQFYSDSIEPRIGSFSSCMLNDALQFPLHYDETSDTHIAVDIATNNRALDSVESNKYVSSDGTGYATVQVITFERGEDTGLERRLIESKNGTSGGQFALCFQPNGQAFAMSVGISTGGGSFYDNVVNTRIAIGIPGDTKHLYNIDVTGLGMIRTFTTSNGNVADLEPDPSDPDPDPDPEPEP